MRIRSFSCLHEKEAPDPFVGMINLKARSDRDLGDVHARRSVGRIIRMKARKRGGRSLHELGIRVWWALFLPFLSHFQTSHLVGPRMSAGIISASIRLGKDGTLPRSRALYTVTVRGVVDACASTPHAPHGVEAPPQRIRLVDENASGNTRGRGHVLRPALGNRRREPRTPARERLVGRHQAR